MASHLIVAGIVLPILAFASVAAVKWLGRWLVRSLRKATNAAVTEIIEPRLTSLSTQLDELRESNTREHSENQRRLTAIEARLEELHPDLEAP